MILDNIPDSLEGTIFKVLNDETIEEVQKMKLKDFLKMTPNYYLNPGSKYDSNEGSPIEFYKLRSSDKTIELHINKSKELEILLNEV